MIIRNNNTSHLWDKSILVMSKIGYYLISDRFNLIISPKLSEIYNFKVSIKTLLISSQETGHLRIKLILQRAYRTILLPIVNQIITMIEVFVVGCYQSYVCMFPKVFFTRHLSYLMMGLI